VIDRGPIQLRAEVALHLPHQVSGEGAQIGHLESIVRRNDEPEMMPVTGAPLSEGASVAILPIGVEHARRLTLLGDAIALEIAQVRRERR
jgi:hypothetical protein